MRAFTPAQEQSAARIFSLAAGCLYDVLEVEVDASAQDIAKAYKKQALRLHPDKNSAPSAEAAMRVVNQAFEVLSDPMRRDWYDSHGLEEAAAGDGDGSSAAAGSTAAPDPQQKEAIQSDKLLAFISSAKIGTAVETHSDLYVALAIMAGRAIRPFIF